MGGGEGGASPGEPTPVNRFMFFFVVRGNVSPSALSLRGPRGLPRPWRDVLEPRRALTTVMRDLPR